MASASRAVSQETATYGSIRALPARPSSHGLSVLAATRTSSSGHGSDTASAPIACETITRRVGPSKCCIAGPQRPVTTVGRGAKPLNPTLE